MNARSRHLPHRLRLGTAAALLTVWVLPLGALVHVASAQSRRDAPPSPAETRMPEPNYLETLNADEYAAILGRKVVGPNGEDLGLITDMIVDRDGRPLAAVIDFGGFLGVGSRKIAVDWKLLQFDPGHRDRKVVLPLDRREIEEAPEYRAGSAPTQMLGPSTGGNGDR